MTNDARRPAPLLPAGLLIVLAMMWVLAVPAYAQTEDDPDQEPPTVTILNTSDQLREGSSSLVYRLVADPAPSEELLVQLELEQVGSSVIPGLVGIFNLTIPAGQSTLDFGIPTINDAIDDADGSMTLSIRTLGTNYQVGDDNSATVAIVDDDEPINLEFLDGEELEVAENAGIVEVSISATVDGGQLPGTYEAGGRIYAGQQFSISTDSGTAASPDDYSVISQIVNLPRSSFTLKESGDYVATHVIEVTINDDEDEEVSEQFELKLERPPGTDPELLTLPSQHLRIVINDDDAANQPGTVSFNRTQPRVGWRFTATLSDPDGEISNKTWEWSRADSAGGPFTDISGATESTYTPRSSDVGKYLKATVTYTDARGTGESATAVSQRPVRRRGC